jgi:hypothetical protein
MPASPGRRQRRFEKRTADKLYKKISQQTLDQINKQSPEEREKLLMLYNEMLRQKEEAKKKNSD